MDCWHDPRACDTSCGWLRRFLIRRNGSSRAQVLGILQDKLEIRSTAFHARYVLDPSRLEVRQSHLRMHRSQFIDVRSQELAPAQCFESMDKDRFAMGSPVCKETKGTFLAMKARRSFQFLVSDFSAHRFFRIFIDFVLPTYA